LSLDVGSEAEKRAMNRIQEALTQRVSINADGERLETVLAQLSQQLDITIVLDKNALDAINITGENLVTLQLRGVSARAALKWLCSIIDPWLTMSVRNEVLVMTTKEEDTNHMVTCVFPVGDLVRDESEDERYEEDYDALLELIQHVVEPQSWDREGGNGALYPLPRVRSLICTQTFETQGKVARLLEILRQARDPSRAAAELAAAADDETRELDLDAYDPSASHAPIVDRQPARWRVPQRYEN
jgi:hypothetical protein